MLDWLRSFVFIPLSYVAAVATMLWIAVEILTLTTWGLFMRFRTSAHAYYHLTTGKRKSSFNNPYVYGALAIALVAIIITVQKRKEK